jgi:hypothetical protein
MRKIAVVVLVAFLASCARSDEGPTAQEKCTTFVSAVCSRQVACGPANADRTASLNRCTQHAATQLDCRKVAGLAVPPAQFDQCIQDLNTMTCDALTSPTAPDTLKPPAACDQIFVGA